MGSHSVAARYSWVCDCDFFKVLDIILFCMGSKSDRAGFRCFRETFSQAVGRSVKFGFVQVYYLLFYRCKPTHKLLLKCLLDAG